MFDLSGVGITNVANVYRNLATPALLEAAIRRREGAVAAAHRRSTTGGGCMRSPAAS